MNTKELEEVVDRALSPAGFRRRKDTWYKTNEDTITLINLQKRPMGRPVLSQSCRLPSIFGKATSPSENQSHIRVRLVSLVGTEAPALEIALDLERRDISTGDRHTVLTQGVNAGSPAVPRRPQWHYRGYANSTPEGNSGRSWSRGSHANYWKALPRESPTNAKSKSGRNKRPVELKDQPGSRFSPMKREELPLANKAGDETES